MQTADVVRPLDQPLIADEQLRIWALRDVQAAQQTLGEIAGAGVPQELFAGLCRQLSEHLPRTFDPDSALAALSRCVAGVRSPLAFAALCQRDAAALPMLLSALSLGPRWAEFLCGDPDALELLRQSAGQPIPTASLRGDLLAEAMAMDDERLVAAAVARQRARHLLRIACGEMIGGWPLETVMAQLTDLAEALVEAAWSAAQKRALELRPLPPRLHSRRPQSAVLAAGKLGAGELDFAALLELLVVYDAAVDDAGTLRGVQEHFDRAAKLLVRFLTETPGDSAPYEVRLLPLPDSAAGHSAHVAEDVFMGFDSLGRTWHRQTMLKARCVAGDRQLGEALLARLQNWLFRRYLSPPDETGIKALKRRIVMDATLHQDDWRSPRLARGALRDIEATAEFLQLLAGGEEPAVRERSTLAAIAALEKAGVLSADERRTIEESYVWLRQLDHRLQTVPPAGSAELPVDDAALAAIAHWCGEPPAELELHLKQSQNECWPALRRLLDSAFERQPPPPREVELLLDPAPPAPEIRAALAPFGFDQPAAALAMLNRLAAEQVPFLSTRRCRHLLAEILPRLLREISATPSPDHTLGSLALVSDSLGSKAVLWDLLGSHPPSLALYVKLCAASPYLSEILTANPGMLDELIDSLQLDKLPTRGELAATLAELCRGTSDTMPVLHDFKHAQHLRIGVRDILGREDIDRTHAALADLAEVCLEHVAEQEFQKLTEKFGRPALGPGPFESEPCRLVIVGLGKLGGREPNYHSPLDLLFLYEGDGTTQPLSRWGRQQRTANNHFFTQLAQRIGKELSQLTPKGRLYAVESALRPIGVGGSLALPLAEFAQHFASGAAPLWHWQALCQARPACGEPAVRESAARLVRELLVGRPAAILSRQELRRARLQLESGASPQNLKRGPGGTLDVEQLVQFLQLESAASQPQVLCTSTQAAMERLAEAGALPAELASRLGESYRFLRRVESGLRLLNTSARHDLPADAQQLGQLALLLGHSNPQRLRDECLAYMASNRALFDELTPDP